MFNVEGKSVYPRSTRQPTDSLHIEPLAAYINNHFDQAQVGRLMEVDAAMHKSTICHHHLSNIE